MRAQKASASGSGCRPLVAVLSPDKSLSRLTKRAPSICDVEYARRPASVSARSCRQSKTIQSGSCRCAASSACEMIVVYIEQGQNRSGASDVSAAPAPTLCGLCSRQFPANEFMEVKHAVFHRRLIWTGFVDSLFIKRPPPGCHTRANLAVFDCRFCIRRLLGSDEVSLEQHDVFRIIKLDYVRARLRSARHHAADDQHVRIPLDHHIGIVREPDRAPRRHLAAITQHDIVPLFVDRRTRPAQTFFYAAGLDAVPITEFPVEFIDRDEITQTGMKWHDMVVLEVTLDECFPVACIFVDLHPVKHVAREIKFCLTGELRKIPGDVTPAVKQQSVPRLEFCAREVETWITGKMRCAQQLPVKTIRPSMDRAYDAFASIAA